MIQGMERAEVLNGAFASVFASKTGLSGVSSPRDCLLESQTLELWNPTQKFLL